MILIILRINIGDIELTALAESSFLYKKEEDGESPLFFKG
jgi:hypothetical protein